MEKGPDTLSTLPLPPARRHRVFQRPDGRDMRASLRPVKTASSVNIASFYLAVREVL
jgi:hypothetical protein